MSNSFSPSINVAAASDRRVGNGPNKKTALMKVPIDDPQKRRRTCP
jgi:hypothetical protein